MALLETNNTYLPMLKSLFENFELLKPDMKISQN